MPKNLKKRGFFEILKYGLSAKVVTKNAPLDGSASSIIDREIYLFRSLNSFDVNQLNVPKFIFEQFKIEREANNEPADELNGIIISESKDNSFGYETWACSDEGFNPHKLNKVN